MTSLHQFRKAVTEADSLLLAEHHQPVSPTYDDTISGQDFVREAGCEFDCVC